MLLGHDIFKLLARRPDEAQKPISSSAAQRRSDVATKKRLWDLGSDSSFKVAWEGGLASCLTNGDGNWCRQ